MGIRDLSTEELLRLAKEDSAEAIEELFRRHRDRLSRMVAARIDRRLQARVDVSDIVQETMIEANRRFDEYLEEQPIAFYPWLRQIAWNRMVDVYRRHITAQGRDVSREQGALPLADESANRLVDRLEGSITSPSKAAQRTERQQVMRSALVALSDSDRELIVMRHLEQLSTRETADALQISEAAAKTRLLRALQRLRTLLGELGFEHE